jgi:bacteriorhodopsin
VKAFGDFREAVQREAAVMPAPSLATMLARERRRGSWMWAAAAVAMVVVVMSAVPLYRAHQRIEQERVDREDAALLRAVDEALSRSTAQALEPLWMGR